MRLQASLSHAQPGAASRRWRRLLALLLFVSALFWWQQPAAACEAVPTHASHAAGQTLEAATPAPIAAATSAECAGDDARHDCPCCIGDGHSCCHAVPLAPRMASLVPPPPAFAELEAQSGAGLGGRATAPPVPPPSRS